jgi:hypothetical protein
MVWIDFGFDDLALDPFLETESEEVLDFFFDFVVLEVAAFFVEVFLGSELSVESNVGWMVVMGVASIGVSVEFVGEVVIGD